jgi:hypothetical protein
VTQSPELAGGAGFTFADQVTVRYLTALLLGSAAPALAERTVVRVALEQCDAGEPLDDIIIDGRAPDGSIARLSLQAKRELTISAAARNKDFRDIVRDAWGTLDKSDFRERIDRIGAVTGPSTGVGKSRTLQSLADLARASATPHDFARRFKPGGAASDELAKVLGDLQTITRDLGRPAGAEDLHKLLAHFVLIRFDALHEGAAEDAATIEMLIQALRPGAQNQAVALFSRLQTLARQGAGRARCWDAAALRIDIAPWFELAVAPWLAADIERLGVESRQAAASIADRIGDCGIARPAFVEKVATTLAQHRFVTLRGLPGSGKSALLRHQADAALTEGPALFLKADRLAGGSWAQFATHLGLTTVDPVPLLAEVATVGTPTLFIDGLDRIDRTQRGIVVDLLNAIDGTAALSGWRVLASLRDSGVEPVRTWLPQLLDGGRVASVRVDALSDSEARELAKARPQLQPLLFGAEAVRNLVRRPFFAKILDEAGMSEGAAPRSETELLARWWQRGGFDAEGGDARLRQRTLLRLVRLRALRPDVPVPLHELEDALLPVVEQLVADGVLEEADGPHFVRFAHDIFFEWSFAQLLASNGTNWIETLRTTGEPPLIGRAIELHGQAMFVANTEGWSAMLAPLGDPRLRSQWRRLWLLAPLGHPEFSHHAATYHAVVSADDEDLLRQALVWFQAQHTVPNPAILDGSQGDIADRDARVRIADLLGWPDDFRLWTRFLDFLDDRLPTLPVRLLPRVLTLFEVWQNALADHPNAVSKRIVACVAGWLKALEQRREDMGRFRRSKEQETDPWDELEDAEEFEGALRHILLRAARVEPQRVAQYLKSFDSEHPASHRVFDGIVAFSPLLSHTHPGELTDFTLQHLKRELPEEHRRRRLEDVRRSRAHREKLLRKPANERDWSDEMTLSSPDLGYMGPDRWDWDALALERHPSAFYPESPLHEPFHSLFANAPDEALRLVTAISNHAVEAWRQLHRMMPGSGTPIPITVDFPWGKQTYWGGRREYLWSRGMWAPNALASAFLAFDAWALAQIDAGADPSALIERIVTGNDSIGVLGIALHLALAKPSVSAVEEALIGTLRLWQADIERLVQETSIKVTSQMGFSREEHRKSAQAVDELNKHAVRARELRNLVPLHVLQSDGDAGVRVGATIRAFIDAPDFELEEQRSDPETRARFAEEARTFAAWGNVEHYRLIKVPDQPDRHGVVMVNPIVEEPEVKARLEQGNEQLATFSLFHWADRSFEAGKLHDEMTIKGAVAAAKAMDAAKLFDAGQDEDRLSVKRGAVAGVAATMVAFAPDGDLVWAHAVLRRAAATPEEAGPLWNSVSQIAWHPCLFVARAAAAELRRQPDDRATAETLMALLIHPLDCVRFEATKQLAGLWDIAPRLAWEGLRLSLELCISDPSDTTTGSMHEPYSHAASRECRLAAALEALDAAPLPLPVPPTPWVQSDVPERGRGKVHRDDEGEGWRRADGWWQSDDASKILRTVPLRTVIADAALGALFIDHCEAMLGWTVERRAPTWDSQFRKLDDRAGDFEWTHGFAEVLGSMIGLIDPVRADHAFLQPICALHDEACFALLGPLTTMFLCHHMLDAPTAAPVTQVVLDRALDRLLAARPFKRSGYRAGELHGFDMPRLASWLMFVGVENASLSHRFSNGDWSEIALILPTVNRFVRAAGWAPSVMIDFLTLVERAGPDFPADAFADAILATLQSSADPGARWRGTLIGARIAARVQTIADRESPLALALGQKLLRILDLLVDQGDRRSAALQISPAFRDLRLPPSPAPAGTAG